MVHITYPKANKLNNFTIYTVFIEIDLSSLSISVQL